MSYQAQYWGRYRAPKILGVVLVSMPQKKNMVGLEEVIRVVKRVRTGGLLGPSEGKSWDRLSHKRCGESTQEVAHQTKTMGSPWGRAECAHSALTGQCPWAGHFTSLSLR